MDPRMNSRQEYNRDDTGRKQDNPVGVYYHPEFDKFVETGGQKLPDGTMVYNQTSGKIQADAFVQLKYRPATEEEVKRYRKQQETARAEAEKAKQAPAAKA